VAVSHVAALVLTVLICASVTLVVRRYPGAWASWFYRVLAVVLVLSEPAYWLEHLVHQTFLMARDLPIQLSDAAVFVSAAALWWRTPLLVELTYFWGLAGVSQALATPDLAARFPDPDFLLFYLSHGGVVLAALMLTVGLRLYPRPRAVFRVYAVTTFYACVIALIDLATGWNYMYLRAKPSVGSLLSPLGPWPWYVAAGLVVALILLVLLDAPFWWIRHRSHAQ
jgi:hypothetical integral membrane protein (TIGR02206 family)